MDQEPETGTRLSSRGHNPEYWVLQIQSEDQETGLNRDRQHAWAIVGHTKPRRGRHQAASLWVPWCLCCFLLSLRSEQQSGHRCFRMSHSTCMCKWVITVAAVKRSVPQLPTHHIRRHVYCTRLSLLLEPVIFYFLPEQQATGKLDFSLSVHH